MRPKMMMTTMISNKHCMCWKQGG